MMTSLGEPTMLSMPVVNSGVATSIPSPSKQENSNGVAKDGQTVASPAPQIPHITMNMTPLNVILDRMAVDTYRQFKEFFKFMESETQPELVKKRQFLDMLVKIRKNFVRLYVLCKWSRNSEQIGKLIDLFVWLRDQNQQISSSIMSFGSIKSSLISAKMPEPDLLTSLEVLIQGRPNLPTYNFLPAEKLSPAFVLKVLKNLNVELSIKMALEENIPMQFRNYTIKNGCIYFNVPNLFACSLSTLGKNNLHLIDFSLAFSLNSNIITDSSEKMDLKTIHTIQAYSNKVLLNEGLIGLHDLLYNYALTSKIYLIHKQLLELRMRLWRGHLTHTYNPDNSMITITYWVQMKFAKPSTIQIGKFTERDSTNTQSLGFKWFKVGILNESNSISLINEDDGSINLSEFLNSIIQNHIQSIISNLQKSLIDSVENIDKMVLLSNNDSTLILQISPFKRIVYGIDPLSGSCYFENPTNLMNRSSFKINTGNSLDFIEILKLKMLIQESEFASMMNATGWVSLKSMRLNTEEVPKLNINYSRLRNLNLKSILTSISIYRRKDWPIGWAIFVGQFGFQSTVQLWCCKIQSIEGQWIINWCSEIQLDEINEKSSDLSLNSTLNDTQKASDQPNGHEKIDMNNNNEIGDTNSSNFSNSNSKRASLTYNDLINLIKISSSKLISNLIVKELKDQGCELKILNSGDKSVNDFLLSNFNIDNTKLTSTDNAILLIKNQTLFDIKNAKDSLILLISIKNSDLHAKIFGKVIDDESLKNLPDIDYEDDNSTRMRYTSALKIFQIESNVDLSYQLRTPHRDGSIDKDTLILSNILSCLKKFAQTLNLLKIVGNDPSLEIIKVLPNGVTFKYGNNENEFITLKISQRDGETISIDFPKNNPHAEHAKYLNDVISSGPVCSFTIKELVLYLTLTLKYCRAFSELSSKTKDNLLLFKKQNDEVDYELNPDRLQTMPSFGYLPAISNIENFRIFYFKSIKLEVQQNTGKKKNTKVISDVFKFEIVVQLRHRINRVSKKHSRFLVSLGEMRTETTGPISSLASITNACGSNKALITLTNNVSTLVDSYFTGKDFPLELQNGSVIFLNDSICCDSDSIDQVIHDLHSRLYSLVKN